MGKRPLVKVKKKKRRKPAEDKMRKPEADKPHPGRDRSAQKVDDFTAIVGIGAVTAERLQERGIVTFEQLRTADVSDLPGRVRRAIEAFVSSSGRGDWRESDER